MDSVIYKSLYNQKRLLKGALKNVENDEYKRLLQDHIDLLTRLLESASEEIDMTDNELTKS